MAAYLFLLVPLSAERESFEEFIDLGLLEVGTDLERTLLFQRIVESDFDPSSLDLVVSYLNTLALEGANVNYDYGAALKYTINAGEKSLALDLISMGCSIDLVIETCDPEFRPTLNQFIHDLLPYKKQLTATTIPASARRVYKIWFFSFFWIIDL
jgi:hypothetical protein